MNSTSLKAAALCCLLLFGARIACAAVSAHPQHQPAGLWDYALRQINRADIDYGSELERRRRQFVRRWLQEPRLWMEATGLGLLLLGWAEVACRRNEQARREIVAAEFLAQYHNALLEARIRLEQAIADNARLLQAAQPVISSTPAPDAAAAIPEEGSVASFYLGTNFRPRASSKQQKSAVTAASARNAETASTDRAADLAELRRQLSASHERERTLQKELARVPAKDGSSLSKQAETRTGKGTS